MPAFTFASRLHLSAILFIIGLFAPTTRAADGVQADPGPALVDLAGDFRKHCVRVYIHGRSHDGKAPAMGDFAADIRNERPTPVGGYWWDERHVVVPDPGLQDRFIRSFEIGLPFSDARFPARLAGRFVKLQAMLLEVQPNDEGTLPGALPLRFTDGDLEETAVLSYVWEDGEWRIRADSCLGASAISDTGVETVAFTANGVFVDETGQALGLAFGKKVVLDEERDYWCGRELAYTPILEEKEKRAKRGELRRKLDQAVLEARFQLRVKVDDDEGRDWSFDIDSEDGAGAAELRAAALVVGDRHLFVPLSLAADGIARIEEITVHTRDGRTIPASFKGAFRDYLAVLVETEEALTDADLPPGFTSLNPLLLPEDFFEPDGGAERPEMEYIQRWRIDYSLGRRRETADHDRWLGTFRGYRGDTAVLTQTNEEDGSLAFSLDGRLVAVALTPRVPPTSMGSESARRRLASPGFRPVDFLFARLHSSDVFDPTLVPVAEEEGRRLIDFGVEYQGLDANTARLFNVAEGTRGGRIGLLVTHVYPDSLAQKAGIREHDVLLRLFIGERSEPTELKASGSAGASSLFDSEDMSAEGFQQMLAYMPPPWPARDNDLTTLLTAGGVGRRVLVDYLREGEAAKAEFVTSYTDPDYRNAKKEKLPVLGLTVKPVTYEVGRYFRRADRSGVIVSRVEDGGKAAVAGLHNYLLITRVDGAPVAGVADFRDKMRRFENGETAAVELTVDGFGKTRLVKIE